MVALCKEQFNVLILLDKYCYFSILQMEILRHAETLRKSFTVLEWWQSRSLFLAIVPLTNKQNKNKTSLWCSCTMISFIFLNHRYTFLPMNFVLIKVFYHSAFFSTFIWLNFQLNEYLAHCWCMCQLIGTENDLLYKWWLGLSFKILKPSSEVDYFHFSQKF